jgi:hypothetical protein
MGVAEALFHAMASVSSNDMAYIDHETLRSWNLLSSATPVLSIPLSSDRSTVQRRSRADVQSFCMAEFVAKKHSGDLGVNPDEQGYIDWCMRNPIQKAELSSLLQVGADIQAAKSVCRTEFAKKKNSGDLGMNPDENSYIDWCVRNR